MPYNLLVVGVSPQLRAVPIQTRPYIATGHLLEGRFQQYWDALGGLPVFGFPLNDDRLTRTSEGSFVSQIFERNRFEYHPENRAPYDVLLGRLGDESLRQQGRDWRAEYAERPIGPGCEAQVVDGRRFAVCDPFRAYYRAHGLEFDGRPGFAPAESLALFGLPLTQAKEEVNSSGDRVLTQYFERARFEYHPRNPRDQQVLLGRLGAEVTGLQPLTFDDEDRNFSRSSLPGAPDWNEAEGGIGGHYWWTCVENSTAPGLGRLTAGWANLPVSNGNYQVQLYVPGQHTNTRHAPFMAISGHDGAVGYISQAPYGDEWVTITSGSFDALRFGNDTGEAGGCAVQVAVDAIRLVSAP